jgi:enoyl-CoA hydratase/carnithine racemase
MMTMAQVKAERSGRVMTVTLDNPPRNFMTGRMVGELDELTRALESDSSIGSVVITGAPDDVFITHFDVAEIVAGTEGVGPPLSPRVTSGALRAVGAVSRVPGAREAIGRTPAAGLTELRRIHDLFLRMNRMDKVFIAAVNGLATGGGCELALACDLRYMAEGDGQIGLPEVSVGIIPGAGGTQRMARALGPAKALELILEARLLSPAEALAAGLVHRTVPAERLMEEAHAAAERLARRSPAAVGGVKRAVWEGSSKALADGLHLERSEFLSASSSPQAQRAMKEYVRQLEELDAGASAPLADDALVQPWREGTAVDMVGE